MRWQFAMKKKEQVMLLDDLGFQITLFQYKINEVKDQTNKTSQILGALWNVISSNTDINKKAKKNIYVRSVLDPQWHTQLKQEQRKILINISGYTVVHIKT